MDRWLSQLNPFKLQELDAIVQLSYCLVARYCWCGAWQRRMVSPPSKAYQELSGSQNGEPAPVREPRQYSKVYILVGNFATSFQHESGMHLAYGVASTFLRGGIVHQTGDIVAGRLLGLGLESGSVWPQNPIDRRHLEGPRFSAVCTIYLAFIPGRALTSALKLHVGPCNIYAHSSRMPRWRTDI
ncbi:hypothetical protein L209DRAFT_743914 [Thermothelomyces heterothallicus CBS 203.75]